MNLTGMGKEGRNSDLRTGSRSRKAGHCGHEVIVYGWYLKPEEWVEKTSLGTKILKKRGHSMPCGQSRGEKKRMSLQKMEKL